MNRLTRSLPLLLELAWRNLWRNPRRTLLTVVAITLAVMSMVVLGAFMRAWSSSTLNTTIENLTGHIQIHALHYMDDPGIERSMPALPDDGLAALNTQPVSVWAQRVRVPAMLRTERENSPVELLGIQPDKERDLSFIAGAVEQGSYFTTSDQRGILIGRALMDRLQTRFGRRVVLMSQGVDGQVKEIGTPVVGVFSAAPELERSVVFITLPRAQRMLGLGDGYSEIALKLTEREQLSDVAQSLRQLLPGLDVRTWYELQPFTKAMLEMSEGTILIWILVSFAVVAFGLINTLLMAIYERMREFGLLQALGMRPGMLLLQMMCESLLLVGVATLAGILLGAMIVLAYADGLDFGSWASGAQYFGAASVLYPELSWGELIYIGVVVWCLGVVASLYPAWMASRRVPVDVLNRAQH